MPKGILVVRSGPSDPSREDEYNAWYDTVHLADVCAVPGFVAARRYRISGDGLPPDPGTPDYLAVYEIDSDDLAQPLAELRARSRELALSDAMQMDPPPSIALYELISEAE